jgi:outer membrane protein
MRKQALRLTAIVFLAGLGVLLGGVANAQTAKIGYVNDDRIINEFEGWQKAQEQWEVDRKAWEDEANAKAEDIAELEAEFERQSLILSEEKKAERLAQIETKKEDLDAFTGRIFGPGGTAERKHEELINPLLESINQAIQDVAIEDNYDVVLTLGAVAYIKESFDITDRVLEKLEEID